MLDEVTAIPDLPAMARPITDEPRTSFTLPSEYYTSPAIYEWEKEAIFYRARSQFPAILPERGDCPCRPARAKPSIDTASA